MSTNNRDYEIRAQAEAERAERDGLAAGRDPRVDRYRMIVRALRQPLEQQLPPDFAARVASEAVRRNSDGFEDVLVSLLLLAMGVGALLFAGPALATMARAMTSVALPPLPLPWHQCVMAAICIGVVWAVERGWMHAHSSQR